MQIPVDEIQIKEGRRELNADHVRELVDSIRDLGLLNSITVDKHHTLIAGLHRLEAIKLLEWQSVECTVSSLEGLKAELAEIDENFVRNDLSTLEYSEMLLRRKEIYEMLHPETKHGGDRKSEEIKTTKCRFDSTKSFVQDTAEKLGVVPRTVERQIQTAKNLTPETKEIIKDTDTKITKRTALKLSRLEPKQQKEAATLLATKEIKSVDEYKVAKSPLPKLEPEVENLPHVPYVLPGKQFATFKESISDMKNLDKDCSDTPDIFLADFSSFAKKFGKEIDWYNMPQYGTVFSQISVEQFEYLQQVADSMHSAIEALLTRIERMQENELQKEQLSSKPQKA